MGRFELLRSPPEADGDREDGDAGTQDRFVDRDRCRARRWDGRCRSAGVCGLRGYARHRGGNGHRAAAGCTSGGPARGHRDKPGDGRVFAALTNNSNRTAAGQQDEVNPLLSSHTRDASGALVRSSGNRKGHVLEWLETLGVAGTEFAWRIFLVAGDPQAPETCFAGYDKSLVSPISCPDNVAFDPAGNLWIATDGNQLGSNDGLFAVPVDGPARGHLKQFLTVPFGAKTCGPVVTSDARSIFVAVQHPGETDGSTFDSPTSTRPDRKPRDGYPRPSVASILKTDGNARVGS